MAENSVRAVVDSRGKHFHRPGTDFRRSANTAMDRTGSNTRRGRGEARIQPDEEAHHHP
ncbi:hypothetical protein SAMN04487820_103408 [Actinopolyspora mzabensis]|uniref:Uncharacterized protein n=1 Tax=Actinopolyspora mzabensis TaxID=995066 RepID=A0A1G8YEM1_ACTMZ|nr:hypothetical protein SAMN04487820_103408 [Actinopolyspora mzabensis]